MCRAILRDTYSWVISDGEAARDVFANVGDAGRDCRERLVRRGQGEGDGGEGEGQKEPELHFVDEYGKAE